MAACAHSASKPAAAPAAQGAPHTGVEVEDAIHGVRYELPPGADLWQVSREGAARSISGTEAEVSSFPLAKSAAPPQCRDHARSRLGARKDSPAADAPREESTSDSPAPSWSFTSGPASAPVRNRWAFFTRGADCLVLHVP